MLLSTLKAPHLWPRPIAGDRGRSLVAIAIHQLDVAQAEAALAQASACARIGLCSERCLW